MILSAIAEKLKRRSKDDFKGRHFEATLILQAVSWYLRASRQRTGPARPDATSQQCLGFRPAVPKDNPARCRTRARGMSNKRPDTVGEFAGLAEISTYAGKSTCIVASIRAETGSLSFLAQP